MAIDYTWNIVRLDAYPEHNGASDVVFQIHWELRGADGTYQGRAYGTQEVTLDSSAGSTPFADLTEQQVTGWLLDALGGTQVDAIKQYVSGLIAEQHTPSAVSPPLPWGPSA